MDVDFRAFLASWHGKVTLLIGSEQASRWLWTDWVGRTEGVETFSLELASQLDDTKRTEHVR